jgi:hypothetical protein
MIRGPSLCAMQVAAASSVCTVAALLLLLLLLLLLSPIAVAQLTPITDGNIESAVSAWTTSPTTATTMYVCAHLVVGFPGPCLLSWRAVVLGRQWRVV